MRRTRWALVVTSVALVAIAAASAAGNGGWFPVGDYKTPKIHSLNGAVYALSTESDNGLLVGGNFDFKTADGRPAAHFAIWYPTSFWTAFATPTPLNGDVHAIAWDPNHVKLYVGGQFTDAGGNPAADFLAVWNGTNWAPFCGPFGGSVAALQIIGSTLYVGGAFQNGANIHTANYLIACDLNTGAARVVGNLNDLNGGVYALTADANGTLYAGGQFINAAGIPQADHVAAFNGSWHAMGTGPSTGGGAVDDYVRSLASSGNDVYIGTDSLNVAGIAQADHVARWNGSAWSAVGANSAGDDGWFPKSAFIYALAAKGSQVVAAGSFQNANGIPTADMVANFDGTTWGPLGSDGAGNGPIGGNGLAVAIVGKDVFVGGNFTAAGGNPLAAFIARFTPTVAPSNIFTFGTTVYGNGTASLVVHVPGAGRLAVSGAGVVAAQAMPNGASTVGLPVVATGAAAKTLAHKHRVTLRVAVTFTPTGGTARRQSRTVVLKKH